jgi:chromosome segregation ATPase
MGNKLQNAADALQKVARDYQAVIDLAAELGRIGNIEAAEEIANRRLAQARSDLNDVTKKLEESRYVLSMSTDEVAEKIRSANDEAAKIIASAQDAAAQKHSEAVYLANEETKAAREQAARIIAEARTDVEAMRATHEDRARERADELEKLDEAIKKLTETLTQRQADLAAIEARLASIHDGVANLSQGSA